MAKTNMKYTTTKTSKQGSKKSLQVDNVIYSIKLFNIIVEALPSNSTTASKIFVAKKENEEINVRIKNVLQKIYVW